MVVVSAEVRPGSKVFPRRFEFRGGFPVACIESAGWTYLGKETLENCEELYDSAETVYRHYKLVSCRCVVHVVFTC